MLVEPKTRKNQLHRVGRESCFASKIILIIKSRSASKVLQARSERTEHQAETQSIEDKRKRLPRREENHGP